MNSFFRKIIYTGIDESIAKREIKYILLLNGSCFIASIVMTISVLVYLTLILSGLLTLQKTFPLLIITAFSVVALLLVLYLNKNRLFFVSKNILTLIVISSTGFYLFYYGISHGIGLLVVLHLIIPLLFFSKIKHLIIYSLIYLGTLAFSLLTFASDTPLIVYDSEMLKVRSLNDIATMVVLIYFTVLWIRLQNDVYETKLNKAIKKLAAANKSQKQFIAYINHEFRNPVGGINSLSKLIMKEDELTGKQYKYIKIINNSSNHLLELINDILDSSKIEAGKIDLHPKPFDIKETLADIRDMFETQINDKTLEFKINMNKNIPETIIADEKRFKQIVINLISNAIKFTKNGGIHINGSTIENSHQSILLCVHDTGIGIDKMNLDKVFNPYEQICQCKSNVGTGLGLSISKNLAQQMGGDLTVSSTKDTGSCFCFTFKTGHCS